MERRLLVEVKHKKNKEYVNNFQKLVSETDPRLTIRQLENLCSQKPFVGHVLEGVFGYKKVLRLGRLLELKVEKYFKSYNLSLVKGNIKNKYSLGIGTKKKDLEIFMEISSLNENSFSLTNATEEYYEKDIKTDWVKPSEEFLQQTFNLLPRESQETFQSMLD
jgi:hypothetical protein